MPAEQQRATIEVFVSYSHVDKKYVRGERSLLLFLRGITVDSHEMVFWWDKDISVGSRWDVQIQSRIQRSDIVLALVSQHFLNSPYIQRVEVREMLESRRKDGTVVFPIIIGPCDWQEHKWLRDTYYLPTDGKTVEEHFYTPKGVRERFYLKVRQELTNHAKSILATRKASVRLSGTGSQLDSLMLVEDFLNAGDYLTAINRVLGECEYAEAALDKQLDVAVICQKMGKVPEAKEYLKITLENLPDSQDRSIEAQFRLLRMKVLSQEGRHAEFLDQVDTASDLLIHTDQEQRLPQLYHRAGTAAAIVGHMKESARYFRKARQYADGFGNRHAAVTTQVFWSIAAVFRGISFEPTSQSPRKALIEAQLDYLSERTDTGLWQANRFKSAVQAMFGEAAVLLHDSPESEMGWTWLTAAHLLAPRARAHPQSEGYAELLWLIDNVDLRELIESASRVDETGRIRFQRQHLKKPALLDSCRGCLSLPSPTGPSDWEDLRKRLEALVGSES